MGYLNGSPCRDLLTFGKIDKNYRTAAFEGFQRGLVTFRRHRNDRRVKRHPFVCCSSCRSTCIGKRDGNLGRFPRRHVFRHSGKHKRETLIRIGLGAGHHHGQHDCCHGKSPAHQAVQYLFCHIHTALPDKLHPHIPQIKDELDFCSLEMRSVTVITVHRMEILSPLPVRTSGHRRPLTDIYRRSSI